MAVEKTGTENEVILFILQSAEGQMGLVRQLSKGCVISLIVSFMALKSAERESLDRINKVSTSSLNSFLFTRIKETVGFVAKEVLVPPVLHPRTKVDPEI